jgi:hydrogenase-1 operon protein HyaF
VAPTSSIFWVESTVDRIDSISIEVEDTSSQTGNVLPLLHEVRHALKAFADSGTEHTIDLNGLPMAPEEDRQLERLLGTGEVRAELNALGTSEITETAVPGVWRVTHYNGDHVVVGRFLEITDCPAILKSQRQDLAGGISQLQQMIDEYE